MVEMGVRAVIAQAAEEVGFDGVICYTRTCVFSRADTASFTRPVVKEASDTNSAAGRRD
jgi:hypothetical protein